MDVDIITPQVRAHSIDVNLKELVTVAAAGRLTDEDYPLTAISKHVHFLTALGAMIQANSIKDPPPKRETDDAGIN